MSSTYHKAIVKRGLEKIDCPDLHDDHKKYEGAVVDIRDSDWRTPDEMHCFQVETLDGEELWYYEDELELYTKLEWKIRTHGGEDICHTKVKLP